MFAHVLAVLLGLGSLLFYLAAFFYPEVHRRSDFLWGGLGLLYSAVLWFGAGQMTELVLLGQLVAVALLLGLGWQTLTVRREKTPVYQQTPIVLTPDVVGGWAKSKLNELRIVPDENVRPVRLERRAIAGATGLNARLDPRRRPAYDYEFVEDGVGLAEVQQGELFATAFAEETTGFSESLDKTVADFAYSAPPSAAAEVVAVEPTIEEAVPEALIAEEAVAEEIIAEEVAPELVDSEPESELSLSELGFDERSQTVDDLAIANKTNKAQWIDEIPTAASQPKAPSVAAAKKPGLLAMPMILLGWAKDVVISLTKPKPSKPMIEIPRREASVSAAAVREPVINNSAVRDRDVSTSAESNSRYNNEPEADDWEDSNWAD